MEDPATWGPLEKAIQLALEEDHRLNLLPPSERPFGLSLVRRIADAVRDSLAKEATNNG